MPWLGTGFKAVSSWQKTQFRDTVMAPGLGVCVPDRVALSIVGTYANSVTEAATSVPATTMP